MIKPVFDKAVKGSLFTAAIMVFFLAQNHLGFMLYFVALPLLGWIPYNLFAAFTHPETRASRLTRVSVWVVAVALVVVIHYVRHEATRHDANEIVAAIKQFSAAHRHCPASLNEIGLSDKELRDKLGYAGYYCEGGKPHLFYAATYIVFDVYSFDFDTGVWKYVG